jgi:hypothetical protein
MNPKKVNPKWTDTNYVEDLERGPLQRLVRLTARGISDWRVRPKDYFEMASNAFPCLSKSEKYKTLPDATSDRVIRRRESEKNGS